MTDAVVMMREQGDLQLVFARFPGTILLDFWCKIIRVCLWPLKGAWLFENCHFVHFGTRFTTRKR